MTEYRPEQDQLSEPDDAPAADDSQSWLFEAEEDTQGDIFEPAPPPEAADLEEEPASRTSTAEDADPDRVVDDAGEAGAEDITAQASPYEDDDAKVAPEDEAAQSSSDDDDDAKVAAEDEAALASNDPNTPAEALADADEEPPNPLVQTFLKLREGRRRETADLHQDIVKPAEPPAVAQMDRGKKHDETGRHEMAVEEFLEAVELDPENVDALTRLAAAYGALGRFVEADEAIGKAMKIAPEDVEVQAGEAILSFRKGLYSEAEVRLKRVCTAHSSHGPAHFYRGEALNRLGRVEEAVETMERTIQLQPRNWRAYHTLGMLFDRLEDRERASEMYRRARELNPL